MDVHNIMKLEAIKPYKLFFHNIWLVTLTPVAVKVILIKLNISSVDAQNLVKLEEINVYRILGGRCDI